MTLNELRYIVAVAEHRHFGKAARACCISQPTLSTQIKKLEEQLGVVLFERTNKSVRPTAVGDKVVRKARKVLDEIDDIRTLCRGDLQPLCGTRTLGVIPTLAPYLLPWLLPPLRRAYPALELVVVEDITARLIARLKEHSLDVAMVALPISERDLIELPLFDEPFHVACPAGHRLARAAAIRARRAGARIDPVPRRRPLPARPGAGDLRGCGQRLWRRFPRRQPGDPAPAGRRRPRLHPAAGARHSGPSKRPPRRRRAPVRRHGQSAHRPGLPHHLRPSGRAGSARRSHRRARAADRPADLQGVKSIAFSYRYDCNNQIHKRSILA
jgi:DNA-binding transcriptional LysR family regulator